MTTPRPPERRNFMRAETESPSRPNENTNHRAKLHDAQAEKTSSPEEYVRDWLLSVIERKRLGSAAALAKLAGVAPSTITRGVDPRCPVVPSGRTLAKIAQATGNCFLR